MQRQKKPLSPLVSLVLLIFLVIFGTGFVLMAFIGLVANPWSVLTGLWLGSVLYYFHRGRN